MGQDRGGLYSYEKLENLVGMKHRNADRIHPEWQQLAVGDVVRVLPRGWMGLREGVGLPVAALIEGQSIVLRLQPPDLPVDGVWSFHVMPRWEDRCRLLVRTRLRMRVPGEAIGAEAAGPVMSLMTRGMLLGIKRRVEQSFWTLQTMATAMMRATETYAATTTRTSGTKRSAASTWPMSIPVTSPISRTHSAWLTSPRTPKISVPTRPWMRSPLEE